MNKCNYYVLVLFNVKMPHLGNNTNSDWLDYRLELFQRYTLRSLLNQTDNHFRVWMTCLEESESILAPKVKTMKEKHPEMDIVDFVFDENKKISYLENNNKQLYFLKIDSDDLYHRDVERKTKEILSPLRDIPMLMFCNGYIYDIRTRKMSTFVRWSMPNIAIKYSPGTFTQESFYEHCRCDLTKVRNRFDPIIIKDRMVCCLDHKMNLHVDPRRNGIEIGRRTGQGYSISQDKTSGILEEFGIRIGV